MDTQQAIQNADIRDTFSPATRAPPDIKIVSHSNVFYWWPAWVVGFAVALITLFQGQDFAIEPDTVERIHPGNNPGIFFIVTLVLAGHLHQLEAARHLLNCNACHGSLFRRSFRVARVVGQHTCISSRSSRRGQTSASISCSPRHC